MSVKATILLPVYNCQDYIKDCIESLLNQTVNNFEILIINDGSSDQTVKIIESYTDNRIKLIHNEKNIRLIKTLNKGLDLIQSKYIIRMDADDVCELNRIEEQIKFMEDNPEIGISGTWFKVLGKEQYEKRPENHEEIKFHLFHNNCIPHPTVIMRKSELERHNLKFSLEYLHVEDYEFWVRALRNGVKLSNIPKYLLNYRIHENQISSENFEYQQQQCDVIRLNQLRKLGIKEELIDDKAHLSLMHVVKPNSLQELQKIKAWLSVLLSNNSKTNYFRNDLFNDFFLEKWYAICFDCTEFGIATFKIYNSIELKPKLGFKSKFKFYIKCLLRLKHNKG